MSFPDSGARVPPLSANQRGIIAMLGAMALFTVNDALVKLASEHVPSTQIMAMRGLFAVIMMGGLVIATGAFGRLRDMRQPLVYSRIGVDLVIAGSYVTAIAHMALAEIISILQATPLILTALSVPILGEKVGMRRWLAVLVGFVGVLLILKPSLDGINSAALLALLAASAMAVRDILTRKTDPAVPASVIAFAATIGSMCSGLVLSPLDTWIVPRGTDVGFILMAAIGLVFANWTIVIACRDVDMSVVSPFRFSVVPYALVLGYAIWGDLPDAVGIIGILLIVLSGVYTVHREAMLRRRAALSPSRPETP